MMDANSLNTSAEKVGIRRKLIQHYELNDPNYALIGIVSYLKGHKVAMSFNDELGVNFQQSDDVVFRISEDESLFFPVFLYEDENNSTLFRLITNRTPKGILVMEFRQFDFFIQIEGDYAENLANRLLLSLKQNDGVLASGILPVKKNAKKILS